MTTRLLYGEEDRLLPWALARIGIGAFRPDAKAIGLERDGAIVAVTVYDCFSEADCNVHVASDGSRRWMNREFLVSCFCFPFVQCGFASMTALVAADNAPSLHFCRHVGWEYVGTRHQALPGGRDMVIFEMLKARCRFIPPEHTL